MTDYTMGLFIKNNPIYDDTPLLREIVDKLFPNGYSGEVVNIYPTSISPRTPEINWEIIIPRTNMYSNPAINQLADDILMKYGTIK